MYTISFKHEVPLAANSRTARPLLVLEIHRDCIIWQHEYWGAIYSL